MYFHIPFFCGSMKRRRALMRIPNSTTFITILCPALSDRLGFGGGPILVEVHGVLAVFLGPLFVPVSSDTLGAR